MTIEFDFSVKPERTRIENAIPRIFYTSTLWLKLYRSIISFFAARVMLHSYLVKFRISRKALMEFRLSREMGGRTRDAKCPLKQYDGIRPQFMDKAKARQICLTLTKYYCSILTPPRDYALYITKQLAEI